MRDFDKPYRLAIFTALSGVISVPVFDDMKKIGDTTTLFVLLGGQRSVPDPEADHLWGRRCSIEIIIVRKTQNVSKDAMDAVAEEILQVLFPSYEIFGLIEPSNFQFANPSFETGFTDRIQISATESIIAKVITITTNIIQQF